MSVWCSVKDLPEMQSVMHWKVTPFARLGGRIDPVLNLHIGFCW